MFVHATMQVASLTGGQLARMKLAHVTAKRATGETNALNVLPLTLNGRDYVMKQVRFLAKQTTTDPNAHTTTHQGAEIVRLVIITYGQSTAITLI
jgi:hypothetical protein